MASASANPITGNCDELMINASWGPGESIAGGTVTHDTFIVRKSDVTVVRRVIADKQRMTVCRRAYHRILKWDTPPVADRPQVLCHVQS